MNAVAQQFFTMKKCFQKTNEANSKALPVLLMNGGSVKKTAMVSKKTVLSKYPDSLINVYHHKLDQIQG